MELATLPIASPRVQVDVEGHEDFVLAGGTKLLKEAPPRFMLVEYNHNVLKQKAINTNKFIKRISDLGYHMYDCQTQVGGWRRRSLVLLCALTIFLLLRQWAPSRAAGRLLPRACWKVCGGGVLRDVPPTAQ